MSEIAFFEGPILAIETSCDETSASILTGRTILSSIVSSQVDLHAKWGGVVPEAAARAHVEAIVPVLMETYEAAGVDPSEIRGVAVTNRPGLVGALEVGVSAAKAVAFAQGVPLVGVHHLEGHLLSVFAKWGDFDHPPTFPHLALIVSGGHTELVEVVSPRAARLVGHTIDDAAGEAFDKSARLLGLGYPGGRALQDQAERGDAKRYPLPRAQTARPYDFSFSGLKTAVLRLVESERDRLNVHDAAAAVQEAIVEALVVKTLRAADELGIGTLTLVGGVAANRALRERLERECFRRGWSFHTPPLDLCTDNAAMIGLVGSARLLAGQRDEFDLEVFSNAELPSLEVR